MERHSSMSEVFVQWLNKLLAIEAGVELGLACLNCLYFWGYAARTRSAARRAAAMALVCVSAGFGSEALLFLSIEQPTDLSTWQLLATAFVRTTLLAGCGVLSLLALRATWNRVGREGRHDNVRGGR
jgi:hypothetical protein